MRKKNIFIVVFILFCYNAVFGQVITGNVTFPARKVYFETIDTTQLTIWYDYAVLKETKEENSRASSQVVVQIGKNYVKSMDVNKQILDSLDIAFSKLDLITVEEMNVSLPIYRKNAFRMDVFYDIAQDKYTVQKKVYTSSYEYEVAPESIHNNQWKLKKEYKTVLGYKAQKATLDYGGRKWIAWFTKEIPVNYGPYVFGGLPGLIIDISDSEGDYVFTMKGLSKSKEDIYIDNNPERERISQKEFMATEERYHKRPDLFITGKTVRYVGAPPKRKTLPYNPIEKN